jgi:hypothetical protein
MMLLNELLRDRKRNFAYFQTVVQRPAQRAVLRKNVVNYEAGRFEHPLCSFPTAEASNGIDPSGKVPLATGIKVYLTRGNEYL